MKTQSKKTAIHEADLFTPGLLKQAMTNKVETHNPVTDFRMGDIEFQLVLKRVGGRRVLSRSEALLVERVKAGQQDLDPSEIRAARRILAGRPKGESA